MQNNKLTGTYWSTYADVPRKEFHSFQWRMGVASLPAIPQSAASKLYSGEFEDAASRTPSTTIPLNKRKDVLGGNAGQIAHILPHRQTCARVWTAVLRTLFQDRPSGVALQRLVHGIKKFPEYCLRNVHWNKLCLWSEGTLFDSERAVCFMPCMSLKQMLAWQGEEYHAIVVGASADFYRKQGVGSQHQPATDGDIQTAFEGLNRLLRHLASRAVSQAVLKEVPQPQISAWQKNTGQQPDSYSLCHAFHDSLRQAHVRKVVATAMKTGMKFARVHFQQTSFNWSTTGQFDSVPHPAPHPLLLAIRACNAFVYHTSGNKHLPLPACMPASHPDEHDSDGISQLRAVLPDICRDVQVLSLGEACRLRAAVASS